jgi:SAM-dependent methyltransferase
MHQSSLRHVQDLLSRYIIQPGVLADIGSTDVNGTYRPLFSGWRYIGIDTAPGPGVDVVARNPYRYPLPSASVDLVVCGQVFEHMEYFWLGWLDMCRIVKPVGLIFLLAPSRGPEHRYPVDCWRFYPDGFKALAKWAGVELLEVSTDWTEDADPGSAPWGDTVGVFRRPPETTSERLRRYLLGQSCHLFGPGNGRSALTRGLRPKARRNSGEDLFEGAAGSHQADCGSNGQTR